MSEQVAVTFPDGTVRDMDIKSARKYLKHMAKTHSIYITSVTGMGKPTDDTTQFTVKWQGQ